MNKTTKTLLITATVLSGALATLPISTQAETNQTEKNTLANRGSKSGYIASGTHGTSPWYITGTGVLHVGAGELQGDGKISPWLNYKDQIKAVVLDGKVIASRDSRYLFSDCVNVSTIENLKLLDTTNVTNFSGMFYGLSKLTSLDLSNFNTTNAESLGSMFSGTTDLQSLDLSSFDTKNVTNMSNMFSGAAGLQSLDLSNFDTKNVTDMSVMFNGATGLQSLDLSNFDTKNVTNMSNMFDGATGLQSLDLSNFDTKNVTNMSNMFGGATDLQSLDLSNFDTTNVTDMSGMFGSSPISELKLGSKTKLSTTVGLAIQDTSGLYSGKWQTMGTGTPTMPNGNWIGTTDDLIARTALGNADTYVLQRSHNYVFTANNIEVKQSDVAKLDLIKASKANVKDTVNPSATFNIEVKDKGGLTNKVGTYKVVLSAKGLTDVTKTINVKVVADSIPKPQPNVKYQAVYRLYNKNTGEHFYTESAFERNSLVKGGWNNEGTGWSAPDKGTAVYRVYNPNAKGGDHYYTASKFEADSLVKTGWKWDNAGKPVFYSGGKTPVYVAFNPNAVASGSHNYTSNSFEQQSLLKNGWKFVKVQFYGK